MPRMTDDEVVGAIYEQIADAEGYETDELAEMRRNAIDYYYNRDSIAPHNMGRSSVQSSDIADMIEHLIAQIMPAFDGDCIVEFEPISEEDDEQARSETNAVNWVVMQQNKGYYEIQQALRDALLLRNGLIKVYLDEKIDIRTEKFVGLTVDEARELSLGSVTSLRYEDNGQTVKLSEPDEDGFVDATVKIKTTKRKVCVQSVDPTQFSWERDHDSIYLQDCRFCAERSLPTRSELIEMGYSKSKVNALSAGSAETHIDRLARNQHSARRTWRGHTAAQDLIEFYECYIRMDRNGDGVAELLKVCVADKKILEIEEIEYIPYASGTPFLQAHRFNGLGMYDKLRYIQDAKTATIRQLLDNQNHANNARVGIVDGAVNQDDVVNSRPGGVVRMRAADALVPFPFTDIGPSAINALDYMDKMRSERGGASLDMATAEMQVAGDTAHGVERQMSAKEQLAAMITRTIAETLIRCTYELAHKALRLYVPDELSFRVAGQWSSVNPSEWQEREHVVVKSGISLAERMQKRGAIQGIMAHQAQLMEFGKGGELVNDDAMYAASIDNARANGMQNPEQYYVDPQSEEAQQARQMKAEQAEQEAAAQQQLVDLQKYVEDRNADIKEAQVIEDARQFDEKLEFDYWKEGLEAEAQEAELTINTALELVRGESEDNEGETDTGKSAAS